MAGDIQKMRRLFMRQSYLDAWEMYKHSMEDDNACVWDYIILTASNEIQAEAYRTEILCRLKKKVIPDKTEYVVIPDPDGRRVGSGGATLNVLKYLNEKEGRGFTSKRILVIHSGGDSKRIPQYSVCGKLFSPVPRQLPDGRMSTLFDEFLIAMSGVPGRLEGGMMTLSGDVMLLFNALQLDFQFKGAAAISIKESVETGKDHGVFLNDTKGYVGRFLHKQTIEQLEAVGAVNEQGNVDLDTGAIVFDSDLLDTLWGLISTDGEFNGEKFDEFVNEDARISFYGDFLYPLATMASLDEYYVQPPEGSFTPQLKACRKKIWDAFNSYTMKLICLAPAEFIHFGTTDELWKLEINDIGGYEHLGWQPVVCSDYEGKFPLRVNNGHVSDDLVLLGDAYVENCSIGTGVTLGDRVILSGLSISDREIPANCCIHLVKLIDGGYVARVYDMHDNPKNRYDGGNMPYLSTTMGCFMEKMGLEYGDLWKDEEGYLWDAALFPVCATEDEAIDAACAMKLAADGAADLDFADKYKTSRRMSLSESFKMADAICAINAKFELAEVVKAHRFINVVRKRGSYETALDIYRESIINSHEFSLLMDCLKDCGYSEKMRGYLALSKYMKMRGLKYTYSGLEYSASTLENLCFDTLAQTLKKAGSMPPCQGLPICKNVVKVELPVRVNWGGGWTDTPPYCNENGGVVLNAAIIVNGKKPVCVEVRKIDTLHIEYESEDIGVKGSSDDIEDVIDCNNPYDYFALHKAALVASGIIPVGTKESLEEVLERIGGGIYISTKVIGIPKGSGLGTSSILAGAAIKALAEFTGADLTSERLYETVLIMEQLMSTGGGWQDQVGGLSDGIKFITTEAGVTQNIKVEHLDIPTAMKTELSERFAIIYTGQRRLARNLLREVVGNYISGRRETIYSLSKMKKVAEAMKESLVSGSMEQFIVEMNHHWELSKMLDQGVTNTCIDQIFNTCEDLIDARFIAGAGGGGFLQVILKEGVTKKELNDHLAQVFAGTGVAVWDSDFAW